MTELVERTLPASCGGAVGDYQLVEEQDGDGHGHLTLRVHPRVVVCQTAGVLAVLRRELASGSRGKRHMAAAWYESGALRVVRAAPAVSARGKVPAVLTLTSALR